MFNRNRLKMLKSVTIVMVGILSTIGCPTEKKSDMPNRFLWAARTGNLETLKTLLKKDSGLVNFKTDLGRTAMHLAVQENHKDVVSYLVQKGAKFEARDIFGSTPLHYFGTGDITPVVEFMIVEKKANLNIKDHRG